MRIVQPFYKSKEFAVHVRVFGCKIHWYIIKNVTFLSA